SRRISGHAERTSAPPDELHGHPHRGSPHAGARGLRARRPGVRHHPVAGRSPWRLSRCPLTFGWSKYAAIEQASRVLSRFRSPSTSATRTGWRPFSAIARRSLATRTHFSLTRG